MIVTPEKVKAYAFCVNPLCPGYGQEETDCVKTTVAYTYGDNGADMFKSMVERSTFSLAFADDDDAACRVCAQPRQLSEHPRPSYQPLSGFDPMGLVNGVQQFNASVVNTEADAKVAALEATMALQAAQIAQLLEAVTSVPGDAA